MKFRKFIALLLVPLICLLNVPINALADDAPKVTTKITHKPAKEFVSGQRITLVAKVKDKQGVDLVRAYFKSAQADDYHFVVMEKSGKNSYAGVLPAPAKGAESVEYLILVKNAADQVIKTQTYLTPVKDADDDAAAVTPADKVQVYSELADAPQQVVGFTDSITVDVVESAFKFGYVAGLYHGVQAATAGASTGAVSAGTVAAGTSAIGVGTIAAAAAVVVGGGVAAAGTSSDSGGSGGTGLTSSSILGDWYVTENGSNFTLTFTSNGRYNTSSNDPGDWSLSDDSLTMIPDHNGRTWTGTVEGNSSAFVMYGNTTAYFSRTTNTSDPGISASDLVGTWTGTVTHGSCVYSSRLTLNSNSTGTITGTLSSGSSDCDWGDSYSGSWNYNSSTKTLTLTDLFYGVTTSTQISSSSHIEGSYSGYYYSFSK